MYINITGVELTISQLSKTFKSDFLANQLGYCSQWELNETSRLANIWSQIKQIWVILTELEFSVGCCSNFKFKLAGFEIIILLSLKVTCPPLKIMALSFYTLHLLINSDNNHTCFSKGTTLVTSIVLKFNWENSADYG